MLALALIKWIAITLRKVFQVEEAYKMDSNHSAESLSSRGGSELGSRYMVESGFYMTSFTATIFIGGLIIVGVLLLTLLIALTVMLESCEIKNEGIFKKTSNDLNYCRIYALHAELNGLEVDSFPPICKDIAIKYIQQGHYSRDLSDLMRVAEDYFNSITLLDDGLDVVLIDIDDIFPSNSHSIYWDDGFDYAGFDEMARELRNSFILRMYSKLDAIGWPLILFSRRFEKQRNATVEYLIAAGYGDCRSSLILRLDEEVRMESWEYLSEQRKNLQESERRIKGVISSRMDAFKGPFQGDRIFKLPNPIYYNSKQHQYLVKYS